MELNKTLPTRAETIKAFKDKMFVEYGITITLDVEIYILGYPDILEPIVDILQAINMCDEREADKKKLSIVMVSGIMHEHYRALVIEVDSVALSLQELININNYKDLLLGGINGRVLIKYRRV